MAAFTFFIGFIIVYDLTYNVFDGFLFLYSNHLVRKVGLIGYCYMTESDSPYERNLCVVYFFSVKALDRRGRKYNDPRSERSL